MTVPVATMVCLPMLIEVIAWGLVDAAFGSEDFVRVRSPLRWTSAIITVLPPRVILAVPEILARRETLLPLSFELS
jgi:hypothetical protein